MLCELRAMARDFMSSRQLVLGEKGGSCFRDAGKRSSNFGFQSTVGSMKASARQVEPMNGQSRKSTSRKQRRDPQQSQAHFLCFLCDVDGRKISVMAGVGQDQGIGKRRCHVARLLPERRVRHQ